MIRALVRAVFLALVRVYYRTIAARGEVPDAGPVIVVANHPNALLDPLVLRVALGRPIAFLAKSTLFDDPVGRLAMESFAAIPVYRAKEADTRQNEETFARCRALLRGGGWLALFPEGVSHDAPGLLPLKTGAARIALGAGVPVRVLPVGILYEDRAIFRTRAAVRVGAPIPVPPSDPDDRAAVDALTGRIAEALGALVLQAGDREVWRGLLAVAAWTSPDGGADVAALQARATRLAARYRALSVEDPATLDRLVAATRAHVSHLHALGIVDPLALVGGRPSRLRALLPLVALAPFAAIGALLGWLPYRIVRPLAVRLAHGHDDLVGTYKLLLGVVAIGGAWLVEAVAAGFAVGASAGVAVLLTAPATGWLALRWDERWTRRAEALHAWRIGRGRADEAGAADAARAALIAVVEGELDRAAGAPGG